MFYYQLNKIMRLLIGLFLLTISSLHAASLPAPVAKSLMRAGIPQDAVAIIVQQVDRPSPLLEHNVDMPMNPASTMKLLTTYAGLELLGPAYQWKTEIYANGQVEKGVLDGDLIIKGYGDPALTLDRFQELLRKLKKTGLHEIRGDLVLDNRWFDLVEYDPGAFDGKPWRAYNTPPDALLVNFKATKLTFQPDLGSNRVLIDADPALTGLQVINQVELRRLPCFNWKSRLDQRVSKTGGDVSIEIHGDYSSRCGKKTLEMSLLDNANYVYALFRQFWEQNGGVLHGNFRQGETPSLAKHLISNDSPALIDVIRMINKYSNNVMARQLLLTIGAEKGGVPGSVEKGITGISSWLERKKLYFPELVIENGSGLSRQERISARHMADLLRAAWRSPVMPELVSSLPITAVDGTLRKRLKNSIVDGQAHLKTGSLDGVSAVAGYLLDRQGKRWVVVFMVNHPNAVASRQAQDILLEWVHEKIH